MLHLFCNIPQKEADAKTLHASSITTIHFDPFKQPIIQNNTYWKVLDLSYLKLREDVISLKQLTKLEILNLTGKLSNGCMISTIQFDLSSFEITKHCKSLHQFALYR